MLICLVSVHFAVVHGTPSKMHVNCLWEPKGKPESISELWKYFILRRLVCVKSFSDFFFFSESFLWSYNTLCSSVWKGAQGLIKCWWKLAFHKFFLCEFSFLFFFYFFLPLLEFLKCSPFRFDKTIKLQIEAFCWSFCYLRILCYSSILTKLLPRTSFAFLFSPPVSWWFHLYSINVPLVLSTMWRLSPTS